MTSKGYLKLTDFGISKILENIDCCTSTSGTHGYMVRWKILCIFDVMFFLQIGTRDLFSWACAWKSL